MLSLYNTLSKKKEEFVPITPGHVGMYNCGPTVYDRVHIGNLRALIFADTLRRVLEHNDLRVTQVMNITDVGHLSGENQGNADIGEDKMTKGLQREGLPITLEGMKKLAEHYTDVFVEDMHALNVLMPATMPRASEHIQEQIELIQRLEKKGLAYVISDGVYFNTGAYPAYGKLGGISEHEVEHARVEENTEKKHQRDFALWKFNSELGWESPWGKGFPGWHIECSAMAMKYLGETFDIHTGGIEHIPVHHNNEIAQAEAATDKTFARFWLHNDHVRVEDKKMAKSEGTGFTRLDLKTNGVNPLAYRYWVLTAHYRSPINFTWDAVKSAQNAYNKLVDRVRSFGGETGAVDIGYEAKFKEAVNDDLNTSQAIALMWDMLKDDSVADKDKKATLFYFDRLLGLGLRDITDVIVPEEVQKLIYERESARAEKNWAKADEIRLQIQMLGFDVKDTPQGFSIVQK